MARGIKLAEDSGTSAMSRIRLRGRDLKSSMCTTWGGCGGKDRYNVERKQKRPRAQPWVRQSLTWEEDVGRKSR